MLTLMVNVSKENWMKMENSSGFGILVQMNLEVASFVAKEIFVIKHKQDHTNMFSPNFLSTVNLPLLQSAIFPGAGGKYGTVCKFHEYSEQFNPRAAKFIQC